MVDCDRENCCPGARTIFDEGPICAQQGKRCVCNGVQNIDATCSDGWTDSPCCADSDCAWEDNKHMGYCTDNNKCVVWEKWPLGHACRKFSDCMSANCDVAGTCAPPLPSPEEEGGTCTQECKTGFLGIGYCGVNKNDCKPGYTARYTGPYKHGCRNQGDCNQEGDCMCLHPPPYKT